jgi:hypothetical protein
MANIYIYQIYYDDLSRAALDPGFIPLDNSSNERPDWFEYHPIRKFLLENKLADNAYYGFFSPKFGSKTNLSSDKVKNFIVENEGVDIALFCHLFDQSAFFQNVFWQGEAHHPGLLEISQKFAADVGIDVDIRNLVTDSTNTIFSNYFVAKSMFWTKWFDIAEQLYKRAEESKNGSSMIAATRYKNAIGIHQKVFLMERLATLLLSTSDIYKVAIYEPTELPLLSPNVPFASQAVVLDALKLAYRRLKNKRYLDEYRYFVREVIEKAKTHSVGKNHGNLISQNQNLRRNEACPCGSGKKYKHCHGSV